MSPNDRGQPDPPIRMLLIGIALLVLVAMFAGCERGTPESRAECDHVQEGQVYQDGGAIRKVWLVRRFDGTAQVHTQGFDADDEISCSLIPPARRPE